MPQRRALLDSFQEIHRTSLEDQIVDPGKDGTYSKFRRVDNLIVRTDYSASNTRLQSITYRIDSSGWLLSYEVLGSDRNRLYRATLGYSRRAGPTFEKLVIEKIFDAYETRYFDATDESGAREERPVYQFIYSYNEDGSANEPVGINMMTITEGDASFDFGGVSHMIVPSGQIAPHVVSALNHSYPIEPSIKP